MMSKTYGIGYEICMTLFKAGHTAYFAGGWVRDFILGIRSDEIDIATNAPPYIIQTLFPKTIPVGIQFGVVIVVMEGINFEIATFRKDHAYIDGRHPEGVDFSTAQEDAQRRDFTINGMFYDPLTENIYDYVGGQDDLKKGVIRAIGDPYARFNEDRLRMVRAVRFCARLAFELDLESASAIQALATTLLPAVSMERIWQEISKMARYPHLDSAFIQLYQLGLLGVIFPQLIGLSSEEIKNRVAPFASFPLETPPIVYVMELFETFTLKEKESLCLYLKTTHQDRKIVEFFDLAKHLTASSTIELYEWAHFYAHPLSTLFIEVSGAKISPAQQFLYFKEHAERYQHLEHHIHRIQQKKTLVNAHDLQEHGIQPGPEMGLLLKEAEKIAINHNIGQKEEVLQQMRLKKRGDLFG